MGAAADAALRLGVALASVTPRVEVFTFSTTLERVTPRLREVVAGARADLGPPGHAWGGGTAIGRAFRDFLHLYGARLLGRDTVVVVSSDGLDVGEPGVLRDAAREIHARSAGVVWLNPLLATPGYEPTAAGMRAVRPYVTTFAAAGDAAGLARLARTVRLRT
jgi:uncharacterized protein with von Willebrand factor type A (vWA) domain